MGFVWVNGCFDVLHVGHIRLLEEASRLGVAVIVGIDSDKRVKQLKGNGRPYNNENDRREMLMALSAVDNVVIFNTDDELRTLIKENKCTIILVGEEYKDKEVIGSELVDNVRFFKRIDGYSTTNILSNDKMV